MEVVIGIVIVGIFAYFVASTLAGMAPSSTKLNTYEPDVRGQRRFYREPANAVIQAYGDAATKAAGMNVSDTGINELLVDASPTPRILGGSFGMLVRYQFTTVGSGTSVAISGAKKVGWTVSIRPEMALVEIERTVRMKAKPASGLNEVTANEIAPTDLPPTAQRYDAG